MLTQLIEENFPHDIVSPFQLISILTYLLIITIFLRKFDLGLIVSPLWFDLTHYRLTNWVRKLTFQKPYVISRPELFTRGTLTDNNKNNSKDDDDNVDNSWKSTSINTAVTLTHPARVTTNDTDLMLHCNNARYCREADLARFEWLHQSGLFHACWFNNLSLVTASQTIRYRRELPYGCRYKIVTRCVGWDAKAIFLEHLFVVGKEENVHAILEVREGIAVPKKMKEKYPETATAPLTWAMRNILKWDRETVPDTKELPKDVDKWNQFLVENSLRITGGTSGSSPKTTTASVKKE